MREGLLPFPLTGEVVLLARDAENGVPEHSVRVDLLAFADGVFDWNVRECVALIDLLDVIAVKTYHCMHIQMELGTI